MKKNKFARLSKPVGVVIASAAVLSGALLLAPQSPTSTATAADLEQTLDADTAASISSVFAAPQTSADELPSFLLDGEQAFPGIDPLSTRSVGTTADGIKLWTVLSLDEKVCLISLLPGEGQFATLTCQDPAGVAAGSLAVQTGDAEVAVRAFFIPSELNVAEAPGLTRLSDQILLGNALENQTEPVTLSRTDVAARQAPIELPAFAAHEVWTD